MRGRVQSQARRKGDSADAPGDNRTSGPAEDRGPRRARFLQVVGVVLHGESADFGAVEFTPLSKIAEAAVERWKREGVQGGYTHLKVARS